MRELPLAGRWYVGAIIAIGVALLGVCLPYATFAKPVVFVALLDQPLVKPRFLDSDRRQLRQGRKNPDLLV